MPIDVEAAVRTLNRMMVTQLREPHGQGNREQRKNGGQ